jgi:homocitrate synthase
MARMIVADRDYVKSKYKLEKLKDIEDLVAESVQVNIPFNNPITGFSAFTHKAGIHAKAILNNPSTYEILNPKDFGVERYVHFASRLTGWNAIKSRAEQLGLHMTDAQYKECTTKVKAMADVRALAVDDADSIIRAYYRNLKTGVDKPLLDLSEKEKKLFAEKEREVAGEAEKRELDEQAETEAANERTIKKAKTNGVAA